MVLGLNLRTGAAVAAAVVFVLLMLSPQTSLQNDGPTAKGSADEKIVKAVAEASGNARGAMSGAVSHLSTPADAAAEHVADDVDTPFAGVKFVAPYACAAAADKVLQRRDAMPEGCCASVDKDIDHGWTLSHTMNRFACANELNKKGEVMRVVQVGANSGDNGNDHLVKFVRQNMCQAVLIEPVPWLFGQLRKVYAAHSKTVRLFNVAVSEKDEVITFMAPKKSAKGWRPQMGGINLPPQSLKGLKKTGLKKTLENSFEKIKVRSFSFATLLQHAGWGAGAAGLPHVFVVDSEGYDAVIMNMVLDGMERRGGVIPVLQYEWKHLSKSVDDQVVARLRALGYCVHRAHYDAIAYHAKKYSFPDRCEAGFALEPAAAT
jgi:FkbM family methyltransferase